VTEYEIRLDEQGRRGEQTSGTTVLVAEVDDTAIHWGNHGTRGQVQPIVTVKVGPLMIYLDEPVAGQARLRALRDHCYRGELAGSVEVCGSRLVSTPTDRYAAAEAAAAADDYKLAASIEPRVLFDAIVHDALTYLSRCMNLTILTGIIDATRKAVKRASTDAYEHGREDAKEEIRDALGLSTRGRYVSNRESL